ncbi:MAG TPA: hypothetical protein EYP58_05035 [bacterium (Candidatus Stahlbacteria)]|nr:hypothetical protein [Candidatus Stahlbacteria bacterium]
MKVAMALVIICAVGYADIGTGVKLRNDLFFPYAVGSIRFVTPQGIGFDGQFGFVFDGGDQFLFGGSGIFPVVATKYTSLNMTGGLTFAHTEFITDVDLLEINLSPEVEFSFPTMSELKLELGIPLFSIGFDLENDETYISIFAKTGQIVPVIGFHYYFL